MDLHSRLEELLPQLEDVSPEPDTSRHRMERPKAVSGGLLRRLAVVACTIDGCVARATS